MDPSVLSRLCWGLGLFLLCALAVDLALWTALEIVHRVQKLVESHRVAWEQFSLELGRRLERDREIEQLKAMLKIAENRMFRAEWVLKNEREKAGKSGF